MLGVDRASGPPALEGVDNFHFLQCDLTDASGPSAIVKACTEKFGGRIDALLNVAGVMDFNGSADTLTDDMWDLCMAVNATAPVKLMREVLPFMRQQKKGSIVNVSSKAGVSGAVSGIAYTASMPSFDSPQHEHRKPCLTHRRRQTRACRSDEKRGVEIQRR